MSRTRTAAVAWLITVVGLFYYGYSPFSLVAGAAITRLGPRKVVPIGAATVGVGALLFATGDSQLASLGRFLRGAVVVRWPSSRCSTASASRSC